MLQCHVYGSLDFTHLVIQTKQNYNLATGITVTCPQSFLIPWHLDSSRKYPYSSWKVIAGSEGVGDLKHQNYYLNWNFKKGGVEASNQKNVYDSGLSRKFEADGEHVWVGRNDHFQSLLNKKRRTYHLGFYQMYMKHFVIQKSSFL